jgi:transcriptional antiterminator RfaH
MTFYDRRVDWFLAQLKPNSGQIAARNLLRQGFPTFMPMEDVTRRQRGKFIRVPRPLFPGYLFVSFDANASHWRAINSTHGVTRLVSFGREPAPVPQEIVSELMRRCDSSGKLLPPKVLQPGDQVRLTSGPFANFVAEVEKIAPDQRVWVLMEMMGGQVRVAVAADQVRYA